MLELQQKEMIAGLNGYPAFTLLKQLLRQEIRFCEHALHNAKTPDETIIAAAHWKAFREITSFIENTPENMVRELEEHLEFRDTQMGGLPADYSGNGGQAAWFPWGNRPALYNEEEEE